MNRARNHWIYQCLKVSWFGNTTRLLLCRIYIATQSFFSIFCKWRASCSFTHLVPCSKPFDNLVYPNSKELDRHYRPFQLALMLQVHLLYLQELCRLEQEYKLESTKLSCITFSLKVIHWHQRVKILIRFSLGGFAHVYTARIEGKSGYVVLKRVVVPDGERLKMVEKEIAFMVSLSRYV